MCSRSNCAPVFIDSLQPQLAAYMGSVSQTLPIPGDACLWMSFTGNGGSPGHRHRAESQQCSWQMVVERTFGSMALYHRDRAGAPLRRCGAGGDRTRSTSVRQQVSWTEVIRAITPDHTVLINRQNRRGSMIDRDSMFILETEPAGYVLYAANEAEKASNITLVDVKAVGAFGRLTLAGREGDVEEAAAAAMRAIDHINSNARLR